MRVLHLETGRHLYGGALQVCYLMEGLAKRGVENLLACTRGSSIAREAAGCAVVHELPMRGELDLLFPLRLIRLMRELRPDVVHVHSRRGADLWAGFCGRLAGIPTVVTRRVDNREWPPFARFKYSSYDRVVSISEGIRQVLLEEGLSPEKVRCIHSVVNYAVYQQPRSRQWFSEQFDLPETALVIGVIAQLIPRKGHHLILSIAPRLIESFPSLEIVFFGQGPLRSELETSVSALQLERKVHFAGFRNDMERILPCLDLVVHPAFIEGLGVSLLQAAAAGVPIVGSRAGGIPEIVRDGVNGLLFEPANLEELYDKINLLLGHIELRQKMGINGKQLVKKTFSVATMIDAYLELYKSIRKNA